MWKAWCPYFITTYIGGRSSTNCQFAFFLQLARSRYQMLFFLLRLVLTRNLRVLSHGQTAVQVEEPVYFVDFLREPEMDEETGEVVDAHPSFYEGVTQGLPEVRTRVEALQVRPSGGHGCSKFHCRPSTRCMLAWGLATVGRALGLPCS